jgi:hypothetical protein
MVAIRPINKPIKKMVHVPNAVAEKREKFMVWALREN